MLDKLTSPDKFHLLEKECISKQKMIESDCSHYLNIQRATPQNAQVQGVFSMIIVKVL